MSWGMCTSKDKHLYFPQDNFFQITITINSSHFSTLQLCTTVACMKKNAQDNLFQITITINSSHFSTLQLCTTVACMKKKNDAQTESTPSYRLARLNLKVWNYLTPTVTLKLKQTRKRLLKLFNSRAAVDVQLGRARSVAQPGAWQRARMWAAGTVGWTRECARGSSKAREERRRAAGKRAARRCGRPEGVRARAVEIRKALTAAALGSFSGGTGARPATAKPQYNGGIGMDGHTLFTCGGVDRRWRGWTRLAGSCDAAVIDFGEEGRGGVRWENYALSWFFYTEISFQL
jgi:hypothetical protein